MAIISFSQFVESVSARRTDPSRYETNFYHPDVATLRHYFYQRDSPVLHSADDCQGNPPLVRWYGSGLDHLHDVFPERFGAGVRI